MKIYEYFIPTVPRRILLLIAASVWTAAGGILLTRGLLMVVSYPDNIIYIIGGSTIGGLLFYVLVFLHISRKHTERILKIKIERPCAFSFFNARSYVLMTVMISSGILLRLSGLVSQMVLCSIYITMGIPLFLSSIRFYYNFIFYNTIYSK
jgi:hypothetical protein